MADTVDGAGAAKAAATRERETTDTLMVGKRGLIRYGYRYQFSLPGPCRGVVGSALSI